MAARVQIAFRTAQVMYHGPLATSVTRRVGRAPQGRVAVQCNFAAEPIPARRSRAYVWQCLLSPCVRRGRGRGRVSRGLGADETTCVQLPVKALACGGIDE